jgi:Kef-type K+ transport system membrane component KefB
MSFSDIDPGLDRPGTITAAQILLWLQPVCFFLCGVAPIFLWVRAFGSDLLELLYSLHLIPTGRALPAYLVLALAVAITWTALVARALGERRRWARNAAAVATLAMALAVAVPMLANANENWELITAMPWFAVQGATLICLVTPASSRWFHHESENGGEASRHDADERGEARE